MTPPPTPGSSGGETIVLAVGAHPDDLEELCAATLVALVARGVTVHMASATAGECGSFDLGAAEIGRVRLAEAAASAGICGATFHHLGMSDQHTTTSVEQRSALVDLIRRTGANLLLTHPLDDYHVDHRRTSRLVTDARMAAAVPNFGSEPPLEATPDLAYLDSVMGVGFEPHLWLDVTATMDVRRAMLSQHVSQRDLMQRMYGQDLIAMGDTLARLRGQQRGCEYAEAFRGCGTWPAPDGALRRLVRLLE